MLNTRIVSDSTCDLPIETAEKLGIHIIPNFINVGEMSYLDGVDMSHEDFYQRLPGFPVHPKTSAPGSTVFENVYRQLADEGADQIISMHIHSGLSNLSNVARIAAAAVKDVKITVVEIGQLAMGLGFLVLAAAEAALEGIAPDEIINKIKNQDRRTIIYAALNTLDYLQESGRAQSLLVGMANLLRIKPIVQLHQGVIKLAGQVRTAAKSIDWLVACIERLGELSQVAILHTNAFERAQSLKIQIQARLDVNEEIMISEATPTLGVHVGPGAIGLACVKEE